MVSADWSDRSTPSIDNNMNKSSCHRMQLLTKLLTVAIVCVVGTSFMVSLTSPRGNSSPTHGETSAGRPPPLEMQLTAMQVNSSTTNRTLVFVYGTLKHEMINYRVYLEPAIQMDKASFVGFGETVAGDACLIVMRDMSPAGGNEVVPCLFKHPSLTALPAIKGEIYAVDNDELRCMDTLEGIDDNDYYRQQMPIRLQVSNEMIDCFVYLQKFQPSFLDHHFLTEYTKQIDESSYVPWRDVPDLDALSFLYGVDKMDQLQQLMTQGVAFRRAWLQVIGKPYTGVKVNR